MLLQPVKYLYNKVIRSCEYSSLPRISNATFTCSSFSSNEIVIYNIHGTASKPRIFESLNSQLQQLFKIYCPNLKYIIRTPEFDDRFCGQSIEGFTSQLMAQIYQNHDQGKQFVFVGHSRGGLICSYLAMIAKLNILSIITVSTPFKGTKIASLPIHLIGYPSSLTQMRRHDEFHVKICDFIQRTNLSFIHFTGSDDKIAKPEEFHPYNEQLYKLMRKGVVQVLESHNHSSIIKSPKLAIEIVVHITSRLNAKTDLTMRRVI